MTSVATPDVKQAFLNIIAPYKKRIEEAILHDVNSWEKGTDLHRACEYALLNGGKRWRPALVLLIADALKNGRNALKAAIAVEYFHTASLVVDDLPCMDDEELRRGQPVAHKVFGEATALLVSFALIAEGYESICLNAQEAVYSEKIRLLALTNVTENTGLSGVTGGQFLDLYPPELTEETVREVIRKKTVALYEVAFVLGWLFGGGDPEKLNLVKKAAYHFGMAFQIADDFGDVAQDASNERAINLVAVVGETRAREMFHVELSNYRQVLVELNLADSPLTLIADFLETLSVE